MMYAVWALITFVALNHVESRTSHRIVGGFVIDISEAPYMVQVINGVEFTCGGSIITEIFIATAAHCIDEGKVTIRAGTSVLDEGGQLITAKKTVIHPGFGEAEYIGFNDFGLIVLERPLVFGPNVQPIIMTRDKVPADVMMFAAGWGYYDEDEEDYNKLHGIELPNLSDEVCKTLFHGEYHPSYFCAGYFDKEKSMFYGDSGGALAYNNTLYGMTSFGYKDKVPNYPVAFANVAYAYDWYIEQMKNN